MLSLSVSQARKQFTSILSKPITIIDKKRNIKKAVILPYEMYEKMIAKNERKKKKVDLDQFVGILKGNLVTDDIRYNEILK